jgi:hypothetical protein
LIYFNRSARSLDVNQDGRVDAADAVAAVENAVEGVKETVQTAAQQAKPAASRPVAKKSGARPTAAKKPRAARNKTT